MKRAARTALFVLMLAAPAAAHAESAPVPTLSLAADGSVTVVPDTAIVTLGVVAQADTAGAALGDNTAAMKKTFESLKQAGIAERDIATSNFSIEPVMVYPSPKPDGTQDAPKLVGYRVSNLVTVRIRDVTKTGGLLDAVVKVGANQINGITFTVADEAGALDRARADAMKQVIARAELYAKAGGFTLGRITSVSEQTSPDYYPRPMMMAKAAGDGAADEAAPVSAGEQKLQVTVNVSWEIHQGK